MKIYKMADDKAKLIEQFSSISGFDAERSQFYLESAAWDIEVMKSFFFICLSLFLNIIIIIWSLFTALLLVWDKYKASGCFCDYGDEYLIL